MRNDRIDGWDIRISTFRGPDAWYATVEETAAGARIARGDGPTPAEAEAQAIDKARARLARTRVMPPPMP